jgi:hypothetical protein
VYESKAEVFEAAGISQSMGSDAERPLNRAAFQVSVETVGIEPTSAVE